jgi:hypothetical protein
MTSRNRFAVLAVTGLLAWFMLAEGSAQAAFITRFDGHNLGSEATSPGTNTAITTGFPYNSYQAGTGQTIFYLRDGTVISTSDPSDFALQPINRLIVDVTDFTEKNLFGVVTNYDTGGDSPDRTLLQVGSTGEGNPIHADFTMAANSGIMSDLVNHKATITIPVTLRATSNPGPGDDLSAFNTAGGGLFVVDIDNIDIRPTSDGQAFFPVHAGPVTVNWHIVATPVPEPSSAVSLLMGAGLLGVWFRRRRRVP